MTIQLKPEQEKFIEAQVASGKYNSPEEVMDKMFLVFGRLQSEYEEWVTETRAKIEEGIESLDRGEGVGTRKLPSAMWQIRSMGGVPAQPV